MSDEQTLIGEIEEAPAIAEGAKNGKAWKKATFVLGGTKFSTFKEEFVKDVEEGRLKQGMMVEVGYYVSGIYNNLAWIMPAEGQTATGPAVAPQQGTFAPTPSKEPNTGRIIVRQNTTRTAVMLLDVMTKVDLESVKEIFKQNKGAINSVKWLAKELEGDIYRDN